MQPLQCVLFYGRLITRSIANGVLNFNNPQPSLQANQSAQASTVSNVQDTPNKLPPTNSLRLLTAVSGFAKTGKRDLNRVKPGKFGDDAYFITRQQHLGEVIGKYLFYLDYWHFLGVTLYSQSLSDIENHIILCKILKFKF